MAMPSEIKPATPAKEEVSMGLPTFDEMSLEMRTALL